MLKEKNQLFYLKLVKKFYDKYKVNNYYPHFDTPIYLASYLGQTINSNLMKKIIGLNYNYFKNFYSNLKDFLYSIHYTSFIIKNENTKFFYDKVIITWAFKKDFDNEGSLNDKYLNINSKITKKTLWFVIYLDKIFPKKIKNNLILFQPISRKRYNFFIIFEILIKNFKYLISDRNYYLTKISNHNFLSNNISNAFLNILSKKVKKILILYEGQPFQNEIIRISKFNYGIKTLGYVHAPPVAFPSNFIKKKFSPDKLFLTSVDQFNIFLKLGWKKKNLKIIKSLRFLKNKKTFNKKILLPINFKSEKQIIDDIKFLTESFDISKYKVQLHPATSKFKRNINLKKKIMYITKFHSKKICKKISCPIFIGATGSMIESLERNSDQAIHVTENDMIEKYTHDVWYSLSTKKIRKNIYKYKIKKKGNLLKLGTKPKNLKIFFN